MVKISHARRECQKGNDQASVKFGTNINKENAEMLADILGVNHTNDLGMYLGMPTDWGTSKVKALDWLVDRMTEKTEGWRTKFLSEGGREVLIKSVLQAIPMYIMSTLLIPKAICTKLCNRISNFWWHSTRSRGIHWLNWKEITKHKADGGLGFRDFQTVNRAQLMKQAWRLIKFPESMVAQVMKERYHPNSSILNATAPRKSSWAWRSILVGRDLLMEGCRWRIGDGNKVNVWEDLWIGNERLQRQVGTGVEMVKDLFLPGTRKWNQNLIEQLFDQGTKEKILNIYIPTRATADEIIWPFTRDGNFNTKSGHRWLKKREQSNSGSSSNMGNPNHNPPDKIWKLIWNLKTTPKIRSFIWRACRNSLATEKNKFTRQCAPNPLCQLCQKEEESVEHTLLLCPWAQATWNISTFQYSPFGDNITSFAIWFINFSERCVAAGYNHDEAAAIMAFYCWQIWKGRNAFIFEGISTNPHSTALLASTSYSEFVNAHSNDLRSLTFEVEQSSHVWNPPQNDFLLFNCDAAVASNGDSSAGIICRDSRGLMIECNAWKTGKLSVIEAEAMAILFACNMADRLGLHKCVFESDSRNAVAAINNDGADWRIEAIVKDIQDFKLKYPHYLFRFIPRSRNTIADWIAKACNRNVLPDFWYCNIPNELTALIDSERSVFDTH